MLTPTVACRPAWLEEFQAFIMRGSAVDLAVGVIIGASFTGIVSSLVKDLFNPLIGLLLGGIDFSNMFVTLKGAAQPTLEAAKAAGAVTVNHGLFLNAVVQFPIVALVVFWLVRMLNRMWRPKPAADVGMQPTRDLLARRAAA